MGTNSVHIVMMPTEDGRDGFAQWLANNKLHRKRLNGSQNSLRKFFKKFRYVVISPEACDALRIHQSVYTAKDFAEILIANQRRS